MALSDTLRSLTGRCGKWSGFFEGPTLLVWGGFVSFFAPLGQAGALTASVESGIFHGPVAVSLAGAPAGARLYWTTDGSVPSAAAGNLYESPLRIEKTSILRAMGVGADGTVLKPLVRSYIFPRLVPGQDGAGFPGFWGYTNGEPVRADYEMDPELVRDETFREELVKGLLALPTLSIVSDMVSLFDPTTGIYANPTSTGRAWERRAWMEWLEPGQAPAFRIECGLRIHGGWNRRPEECPKHSMRVTFRKEYGSKSLRHPLFAEEGRTEFETLVLRGGCNNTWLHWSGEERRRGDYLRDQWMRDTARAMGLAAPRGRFVHLYLNGLYWGLYNVVERPGAQFAAAVSGGKPKDYDSRNADEIIEGDAQAWERLFHLANAGPVTAETYAEMGRWLDLVRFADYMLLNFYGANADWDAASNWYAGRRRSPAGPFQFFVWDAERTLEFAEDDRMETDNDQSPTRLFHRLKEYREFRELFQERVRRHCLGAGALTPGEAGKRYRILATQIEGAIWGESARWGDYRRDFHAYKTGPFEIYTRDGFWEGEVARLVGDYFPRRTGLFLEQLRQRGFWEGE